jgi:hypothetical protein
VTRFVNLLEVGVVDKRETGTEKWRGWELELGIPIFDFGGARVARLERLVLLAGRGPVLSHLAEALLDQFEATVKAVPPARKLAAT